MTGAAVTVAQSGEEADTTTGEGSQSNSQTAYSH